MSVLTRLNRPEYLFRPGAVLRRLRGGGRENWDAGETADVRLPWGPEITVFRDEIGHTIIASGVFDLAVTEMIHRLLDAGELAADIGANVGYMTGAMASRCGPSGQVIGFEPHPTVFRVLERNAKRWDADAGMAGVEARRVALSEAAGTGRLRVEGDDESGFGLSSIEAPADAGESDSFEVELVTFDELFADRQPDLVKIDVEGHEHAVLQGGETLLERGAVRDIVFEEHAIYPAPSMTSLEQWGMTLFSLSHSLLGLDMRPIEEGPAPSTWPGPSYLATRDPERALARLRPRGWRCLGGMARLGRARS
jgi:FkbM family methyltransferase